MPAALAGVVEADFVLQEHRRAHGLHLAAVEPALVLLDADERRTLRGAVPAVAAARVREFRLLVAGHLVEIHVVGVGVIDPERAEHVRPVDGGAHAVELRVRRVALVRLHDDDGLGEVLEIPRLGAADAPVGEAGPMERDEAPVVAAVAIAGVSWLVKRKPAPPKASGPPRAILIADFENKTGDPIFDGTLENALGIALEDASFITTFSRGTARKVAAELRPGAGGLSESVARLVAAREGVGTVIAGTVESRGEGYRVSVTAEDARTGKPIVSAEADADGKNAVLGAVAKLASKVRGALGDTKPESARLAAAETFTAGSLAAAHEYALAQDAALAGKWEAARAGYEKAIGLDPQMGRAYAGLAAVYQNEGRHEEAKKTLEDALARLERMSDREKYRTRGLYYVTVRKPDKAIEELKNLVAQYPADTNGIANLALAYFYRREMAQALAVGRRFTEIYPSAVPQRNNVGLFAMYAGEFDTAVREQKAVLDLNPKFHLAFVGLALSQLAEGKPADARETWQKLAALDARGASLAAMGLADMALAAGRPSEAVPLLEKGAADDLEREEPRRGGGQARRARRGAARAGERKGGRRCGRKGRVAREGRQHPLPGGAGLHRLGEDASRAGAGGRPRQAPRGRPAGVRQADRGRGAAQGGEGPGGHPDDRGGQGDRGHLDGPFPARARVRRSGSLHGGRCRAGDVHEAPRRGDGRLPRRGAELAALWSRSLLARPGAGRAEEPRRGRDLQVLPRPPPRRRRGSARRGRPPAAGLALRGESARRQVAPSGLGTGVTRTLSM